MKEVNIKGMKLKFTMAHFGVSLSLLLFGCMVKRAHNFEGVETNFSGVRIFARLDGIHSEEGRILEGNPYRLAIFVSEYPKCWTFENLELQSLSGAKPILKQEEIILTPDSENEEQKPLYYAYFHNLSLKYSDYQLTINLRLNDDENTVVDLKLLLKYKEERRFESDFLTKIRGI